MHDQRADLLKYLTNIISYNITSQRPVSGTQRKKNINNNNINLYYSCYFSIINYIISILSFFLFVCWPVC